MDSQNGEAGKGQHQEGSPDRKTNPEGQSKAGGAGDQQQAGQNTDYCREKNTDVCNVQASGCGAGICDWLMRE